MYSLTFVAYVEFTRARSNMVPVIQILYIRLIVSIIYHHSDYDDNNITGHAKNYGGKEPKKEITSSSVIH
jgi:hypothetical protein